MKGEIGDSCDGVGDQSPPYRQHQMCVGAAPAWDTQNWNCTITTQVSPQDIIHWSCGLELASVPQALLVPCWNSCLSPHKHGCLHLHDCALMNTTLHNTRHYTTFCRLCVVLSSSPLTYPLVSNNKDISKLVYEHNHIYYSSKWTAQVPLTTRMWGALRVSGLRLEQYSRESCQVGILVIAILNITKNRKVHTWHSHKLE